MRLAAAGPAIVVTLALAACAPMKSVSPSPTSTLTADGAFDRPLICREIADYDPVQHAIAGTDLAVVHTTAKAAAADFTSIIAAERAHTWAAAAQRHLPAELRWAEQAQAYYRSAAIAPTLDDAASLVWPDGTLPNTAFWNDIGVPVDITC